MFDVMKNYEEMTTSEKKSIELYCGKPGPDSAYQN